MGATLDILKDFPPVSHAEWLAKVEKDLKGKSFEKALVKKTYEGIDIQPMYFQHDLDGLPYVDSQPGEPPFLRGTNASGAVVNPWLVAQEIAEPSPEAFNRAAAFDLGRGQNSLNVVLDQAACNGLDPDVAVAANVGMGGLSLACLADAQAAFKDIDLNAQECRFATGPSGIAAMALVCACIQEKGGSTKELSGSVAVDPLGVLARQGTLPLSLESAYSHLAALTHWAADKAPKLRTICVDVSSYQESGGNAVQDIACALATGAEYMREMGKRGVTVDTVARHISFEFAIGADFFMEIAKFRAARLCWCQVVEAFGGSSETAAMHIHARTSRWNKTVVDPWVNMLRVSTEAFSGIAGGVNSMHVGPFDEIFRQPNEFSRRIARNVHIVLREEAHFDKVVDPAGGCWYVEQLSSQLAEKAWAMFQQIEEQGGMLKALTANWPQAEVAATAARRAKNIATRTDRFVGTSMYPNLQEKKQVIEPFDHAAFQQERQQNLVAWKNQRNDEAFNKALAALCQQLGSDSASLMEAAIAAAQAGATLGEIFGHSASGQKDAPHVEKLAIHRGAEPFERIRQVTEAYIEQHGQAPKIFLANMGPIPQHKARADFATAFFNVAALETMANNGFATTAEAAQAAVDSQATVMVICSTDATYPEIVPELTQQVKKAKPGMMVILAGYPKEHIGAFSQAGVDQFLHVRANALELLSTVQKHMEVIA